MSVSHDATRKEIAKAIHAHTRAMNIILKKARAAGIRIALKLDGAVDVDGRHWDVGTYGGSCLHDEVYAIAQWAIHIQAIDVKKARKE